MKIKNKFSEDGTRYSIKDAYKACLLCCMGAKIVERDTSDPGNIVFTLEHENMIDLVNSIHDGEPDYFLKDGIEDYIQCHKKLMAFIRETKLNKRGQ